RRPYGGVLQARRLRRGVGVEGRFGDRAAAWPETRAEHLVRVRLAGHGVGAGTFRRPPSGEPRHRDVEAAPEEMHRAALADELATEALEDRLDANENVPERLR